MDMGNSLVKAKGGGELGKEVGKKMGKGGTSNNIYIKKF